MLNTTQLKITKFAFSPSESDLMFQLTDPSVALEDLNQETMIAIEEIICEEVQRGYAPDPYAESMQEELWFWIPFSYGVLPKEEELQAALYLSAV